MQGIVYKQIHPMSCEFDPPKDTQTLSFSIDVVPHHLMVKAEMWQNISIWCCFWKSVDLTEPRKWKPTIQQFWRILLLAWSEPV